MNRHDNSIPIGKSASLLCKDRFCHTLFLGEPAGDEKRKVMLSMIQHDLAAPDVGVTVIDTDGRLTSTVAGLAELAGRDFIRLDPAREDCPFFNPLAAGPLDGDDEVDTVETTVSLFLRSMFDRTGSEDVELLVEKALRRTLLVLKRLDKAAGVRGKYANFLNMDVLLQNPHQEGHRLVQEFSRLDGGTEKKKENADIAAWFLNEYYAEKSKTFENLAVLRAAVSDIVQDPRLRRLMCPDVERGETGIDLKEHVINGGVICASIARPTLGSKAIFFGQAFMLAYHCAVSARLYAHRDLKPQMFYAEDFQDVVAPDFWIHFQCGNTYLFAAHISLPAWARLYDNGRVSGQFKLFLRSNIRNHLLFSGLDRRDISYYMQEAVDEELNERQWARARKEPQPDRFLSPLNICEGTCLCLLMRDHRHQPPVLSEIG